MERRGRLFEAHLLEQSAANEAVVREQLGADGAAADPPRVRGVEVDTGSAAEIDSAPPVGFEHTGFSSGSQAVLKRGRGHDIHGHRPP